MTLGEKIKQARLEAGLSQRQLCGQQITRNMLSQIENGTARPSMDTLSYFARQLDKPVGWFLEEDVVLPSHRQTVEQAQQQYRQGEYEAVLTTLENIKGSVNTEVLLLRGLSYLELARQAVDHHRYPYATGLLEQARLALEQTPYFTQALRREHTLLLYTAQPDRAWELTRALPKDDREFHLRAQGAMAEGNYNKAATILQGAFCQNEPYHYLLAQIYREQNDFAGAAEHYLQAEAAYPKECAAALEECYRQLEDYKMAYHYACKQREV